MTFLQNLKEIYYQNADVEGYYINSIEKTYRFDNIMVDKIKYRYMEKTMVN